MNKRIIAICTLSMTLLFMMPANLYAEDAIAENGVASEDTIIDEGEETNAVSVANNMGTIVDSGMLSDNTTHWSIDDKGQLVFSGNGEMIIDVYNPEPFETYLNQTKEIIFDNNITAIRGRSGTFGGYTIDKLVIPDSVTEVEGIFSFLNTKELIVSTNTNVNNVGFSSMLVYSP